MLYLIGLGLMKDDLTLRAIEAIKKCRRVYLETYTTKLPYTIKELEKIIKKEVIEIAREKVESDFLVNEAKQENIALLIYGDPLAATTHLTLMLDARKAKIKIEIMHNASIFNAIADIGLQLYKFGKTTSLPKWLQNHKPTSFYNIIKDNQSIRAHTLLLIDPGLDIKGALDQLIQADIENIFNELTIVIASQLGAMNPKIQSGKLKELAKKKLVVKEPYGIIILAPLHFIEAETLRLIPSEKTLKT